MRRKVGPPGRSIEGINYVNSNQDTMAFYKPPETFQDLQNPTLPGLL